MKKNTFNAYVELHFMGLVKMDDRSEMLTYVNVKLLKESSQALNGLKNVLSEKNFNELQYV